MSGMPIVLTGFMSRNFGHVTVFLDSVTLEFRIPDCPGNGCRYGNSGKNRSCQLVRELRLFSIDFYFAESAKRSESRDTRSRREMRELLSGRHDTCRCFRGMQRVDLFDLGSTPLRQFEKPPRLSRRHMFDPSESINFSFQNITDNRRRWQNPVFVLFKIYVMQNASVK